MFRLKTEISMQKASPNKEFFLVCIFRDLGQIWRDTMEISVFSSSIRKYEPEYGPYWNTFCAVFTETCVTLEINAPINVCI